MVIATVTVDTVDEVKEGIRKKKERGKEKVKDRMTKKVGREGEEERERDDVSLSYFITFTRSLAAVQTEPSSVQRVLNRPRSFRESIGGIRVRIMIEQLFPEYRIVKNARSSDV